MQFNCDICLLLTTIYIYNTPYLLYIYYVITTNYNNNNNIPAFKLKFTKSHTKHHHTSKWVYTVILCMYVCIENLIAKRFYYHSK